MFRGLIVERYEKGNGVYGLLIMRYMRTSTELMQAYEERVKGNTNL